MNRRRGFTLVEMSIVLVIIGLIIGAIAVGRDLVQATRVRMAIAQIEGYKAAVNTFKIKYNALPGDMTEAQADDAGFTVPPSRPDYNSIFAGGFVTHGNGMLESGTTNGTVAFANEILEFWEDLSSAGLIEGQFTQYVPSISWGNAGTVPTATLGQFIPASKLGNNNWVLAFGTPNVVNNLWTPNSPPGNYFWVGGISSVAFSSPNILSAITPMQAQNIDSKIDDGVFDTGLVRATTQIAVNYFWPLGTSNQCADLVGNAGYLTKLYPDTPACQLSFRFTLGND